MSISDEAVAAAVATYIDYPALGSTGKTSDMMRHILAAAAPYMLAGVTALAAQWEAEGEQSIAAAKKIPDEGIASMLLVDGATMVENARLVSDAIGGSK